MSVRIALMRSILINGQRVKMADARGLVEQVGGRDVVSVIATGNLLFRSRKAPGTLEAELETACAALYGRPTEMVVKTADAWRAMLAANPFGQEAIRAPARVLVWAMREPLPDSGLEQLRRRATGAERVERTADGDIYMWFGEGDISASRLPAGFALKALGAVGTNRNWNTAMKINAALDQL
jgi:uncharacterized protein (DUF1697 family)